MHPITTDPRVALSFAGEARGVAFRSYPARYAKGRMTIALEVLSPTGFKNAANYLLDALNARYSGRSGYLLSPSRAEQWRKFFVAGWDAEMDWRGGAHGSSEAPKLIAPDGRRLTLKEALKEIGA